MAHSETNVLSTLPRESGSQGGKDYIIQIKVRNGPLLRAIRATGMTITAFAVAAKVTLTTLYKFLSLKRPPLGKRGWHPSALRIAAFLNRPVEMLWPEEHIEVALARSSGELEASKQDIATFFQGQVARSPEDELIEHERDEGIKNLLQSWEDKLTASEIDVLKKRFGFGCKPMTYEEIGKDWGVCKERARQVEAKVLRKLRHPWRIAQIRQVRGY